MISTHTPSFQGALDNIPPPPVDISPLVVRGKTRKQRRVSFFPEAFVRYTIHRKDYTREEKRRTWLTLDELRWMKKSCQRLALELSETSESIDENDDDGDDDRCLRGLEGRTRQGISKRKRVRNDARKAVLWEQGLQRKWGVSVDRYNDDTIIADTYYEYTECAQIEAHMVGLRDASEAVSVWEATATTTTTATTTAATTDKSATTTNIAAGDDDSIITTNATIGEDRNGPRKSKPCPDPPGRNSSRTPRGSSSSRLIKLQSLSHLTSTRRLLTDAFFQV